MGSLGFNGGYFGETGQRGQLVALVNRRPRRAANAVKSRPD
jgi:hypothetical protein